MKVLMINKFLYPNGGSETYMFELGKQLKKMGHEVQYFGMEHEGRCVGNRVDAYTGSMDFHGGVHVPWRAHGPDVAAKHDVRLPRLPVLHRHRAQPPPAEGAVRIPAGQARLFRAHLSGHRRRPHDARHPDPRRAGSFWCIFSIGRPPLRWMMENMREEPPLLC